MEDSEQRAYQMKKGTSVFISDAGLRMVEGGDLSTRDHPEMDRTFDRSITETYGSTARSG